MLPDLGPDEGVDLVVPRGEVEERRVDGQVGVEGVDERAEAGPREGGERLQVLDDELHHALVELDLLRVVEGVETSLREFAIEFFVLVLISWLGKVEEVYNFYIE